MPSQSEKDIMARLSSSGLFDSDWYQKNYPDVNILGMDPLEHYVRFGARMRRNPSQEFNLSNWRQVHEGSDNILSHLLPEDQSQQGLNLDATPLVGISGDDLRGHKIPGQPAATHEFLGEHVAGHNGPGLLVGSAGCRELRFRGTLAMHVHLFHLDLLPECKCWLSSIPVPFDLFISIVDASKSEAVERAMSTVPSLNRLYVEVHPNQGRDIAPLVVGFGRRLSKYEYVGHFHSKKSSHSLDKRDWGTQLGHHLFHSPSHTTEVLNIFNDEPQVGLIFPVYHPSIKGQIKWGANFSRVATELARILARPGLGLTEEELLPFPAGSFFLARVESIRPLLDGAFTLDDFEPEAGQVDGTLAHAIERLLTLLVDQSGHTFRQVRAKKPHSLGRSFLFKEDTYESKFLRELSIKPDMHLPTVADPELGEYKISIYTCSTGAYEEPLPFESFVAGAQYIFFQDQTGSEQIAQWNVKPLALEHPNNIKAARMHKTQPHRVLADCDIAIWIDGNVAITGDITPWILRVLQQDAAFGVIPHPYRESVRSELAVLESREMDDPAVMRKQYSRYVSEGFPDNTQLTETNFLIMDLRRSETREALDIWWSEIDKGSRRDQLSFDYACWKAGAKKTALISNGLSIRADPRFAYFAHGGRTHPYLGIRPVLADRWLGRDMLRPIEERVKDSLSVDVVICVHNSPDDVARCLRSVSLARDTRTRVIIVDDGSDLATQAVIARHLRHNSSDIVIRSEEAKGYTRSANIGMRASTAAYIILLNSDTIVPQGWVQVLVNAGEAHPEIGIVGPLSNAASWQSVPVVRQPGGDFVVNELPAEMSVDDVAQACARIPAEPVYPCRVVNGFCFAIKREVINSIGYLDEESFPRGYGEENDYCFRLTAAGFVCGITLSTYVFHSKSKSFSHERRQILSREGWDRLVGKYGNDYLAAVVEEMQQHPELTRARNWFSGLTKRLEPRVKALGFYLPQFHSFEFNDIAWGVGFSEWRNVVKARPRYEAHLQPKLPGELGFYDLRTVETLSAQAQLAREYGIAGMAIYYYRFGADRLMSAPTDKILSSAGIDMRFFYCWANEDWTRAWDGRTSEVLLKQSYSDDVVRLIVADIVEACADPRYIRIEDKPVFMIYQLNRLPDVSGIISRLRELIRQSLGIEIILGTTWNSELRREWEGLVDFIVQFPPHRTPRMSQRKLLSGFEVSGVSEKARDYLESYDVVVAQSIEAMDMYDSLVPGVCPDWDNSPRRAEQANILVGATPEKFQEWVRVASLKTVEKHDKGKLPAPLLFVNAWNEWAEGAMLEPTESGGRAYLTAFRRGIV